MTSALFSPIKLADLQLANRIAVSPMCQYSANDGVADDWHMTHLGMLANSGASFLVPDRLGRFVVELLLAGESQLVQAA